ncbi:MAG TPA: hypothetical protein VNY05_00345 [Candidatus Acidoferrales bacterium]|nr:hypothetical protein [Candidatus Acidoferrales bacterium]
MKQIESILVGCLAISLAGCALGGAPKTAQAVPPAPAPMVAPPPAPPEPLSIPQTNVELPAPQPLDPEALFTLPPPPEPLPEPMTLRRPKRPAPATSNSAPKPEAGPTPAEPEERPAIQEIIPAPEQQRLHDSVIRRKAEITQILNQTNSRRPTKLQQGVVRMIHDLFNLAAEAETHGDLKQADANLERAQVLARELQSAK